MSEVQIAIIDQEDTQITLAVPGVQGPAGAISSGGSANQVFYKVSGTNYDAGWTFIGNANVDAAAAIAGTKISPNFGSQTIATTGVFSHALGAAATPSLTFTGDLNTGIFSPGADQVAVATNGVGRVVVNNIGLGVGIAPNRSIDVYRGDAGQAILRLSDVDSRNVELRSPDGTGNTAGVGTVTNHDFIGFTGNTERLRITSTGALNFVGAGTAGSTQAVSFNGSAPVNSMVLDSSGRLGIGTSSPGGLFHVSGGRTLLSSSDGYELAFARVGNYFYFYNDGGNQTGKLSLTTTAGAGGGEIITFTQDTKRVGIGTTSPNQALEVVGSQWLRGAYTDTTALAWVGTTGGPGRDFTIKRSAASTMSIEMSGRNAFNIVGNVSNTTCAFTFSPYSSGESVRIDNDGRLLVGTVTQVGNVNGGILQLGSGITFPATAVAASDANTLDDYEEGTWTPALKVGGSDTGITYTERAGQYIKIGKLVYIRVGIFLGTHAGLTGNLTITTLPFTPQNVDGAEPFFRGASATGFGEFAAVVTSSSTTILLRNPTTFADLTDAVLAVGTRIYFTGCYPAA